MLSPATGYKIAFMHPRTRELLDDLDAQRAVLRDAFTAVPLSRRDTPPAPNRWSAAGIVEHLAIIEQRLAGLLSAKIAAARAEGLAPESSTDPILPTIDTAKVLDRSTRVTAPPTGRPTGLPADAAWAALERAGAAVRDALVSGDGLALDTVLHPHPLFGPLSAYYWFGFLAAHEGRHAAQLREIVEGPETMAAETMEREALRLARPEPVEGRARSGQASAERTSS